MHIYCESQYKVAQATLSVRNKRLIYSVMLVRCWSETITKQPKHFWNMIFYQIAALYFLVHVFYCREFPLWDRCPIREDDGGYVMTEFNLTGHSRNDLKCAKINRSITNCSMFSNHICACTATAKWWLDGSKIGFLRLDYLSR